MKKKNDTVKMDDNELMFGDQFKKPSKKVQPKKATPKKTVKKVKRSK